MRIKTVKLSSEGRALSSTNRGKAAEKRVSWAEKLRSAARRVFTGPIDAICESADKAALASIEERFESPENLTLPAGHLARKAGNLGFHRGVDAGSAA